jgi:6-pyruvoyltetrahydropterin/6-carboxytetrahydropterin synthase
MSMCLVTLRNTDMLIAVTHVHKWSAEKEITEGSHSYMSVVRICKTFTFDAAHQLIGHHAKCANLHGHTYTLDVTLAGETMGPEYPSEEGFVMDFGRLKQIVKERIVDQFDHAFLAMGNEPVLNLLSSSGSKVVMLGFRTTAENLATYVYYQLKDAGLPIYSVKLWETGTAWAEICALDATDDGPTYRTVGQCDVE